MSDNNYNIQCSFNELAVSYLYGEIDVRDKSVFEEHLQVCSACAGELSGFNYARSSIIEWREQEFNFLATPSVIGSAAQPVNSIGKKPKAEFNQSVFSFFRIFFNNNPILAAGLLIILLAGGIFIRMHNQSANTQISTNARPADAAIENIIPNENNGGNIEARINSDIYGKKTKNAAEMPDYVENIDSTISKNKREGKTIGIAGNSIKQPVSASRKIVKTNRLPTKSDIDSNIYAVNTNGYNYNLNRKSNRKQPIPKLNNIDEDEEEATLHLTDLFDEVGGK